MGVAGRAIGCYGHRGAPCETKYGWGGTFTESERATGKTRGHENVFSVEREEAQEQEKGHDEGPPWVWRCPAARRGEGRRLREAGRVKEPSRWSKHASVRFRLTRKEGKSEKI